MPNGTIDPNSDYLSDFAATGSSRWPTLQKAKAEAAAVRELLRETLREFTSDDVDVVVFGSLARKEWTSGSDVDWTMLIDGQANADHRTVARKIDNALSELNYKGAALKGPGSEGIFGNMAFSHQIVHHIGGQADTNRNTTQRILLLLEAAALRPADDQGVGPCERVVRQVLSRYLASDSNFHSRADQASRIPRFLLNDIVRYWRTMCVDFAYKDWEQAGRKWALRNIKLRMSRKLLFVAGLLTVFSCFHNDDLRRVDGDRNDYLLLLQRHLLNFVHSTPLNIVAWALRNIGLDARCGELLDVYEEFLASMDETPIRDHLTRLSETAVYDDEQFLKLREISHRLQGVLRKVCFQEDTPLREFTYEYGVF